MIDTITFSKPTLYRCSKHGDHDATMILKIYAIAEEGKLYRTIKNQRIYCCLCYMEALDKLGIEDMKEVTNDQSNSPRD